MSHLMLSLKKLPHCTAYLLAYTGWADAADKRLNLAKIMVRVNAFSELEQQYSCMISAKNK